MFADAEIFVVSLLFNYGLGVVRVCFRVVVLR